MLTLASCNGSKKAENSESGELASIDVSKTSVIYFHTDHRCATCMAVENTTKAALEENFGEKIPFYSVDINLDENKGLVKQFGIAGQTLLIVKGDKQTNITANAFMFARSKPEKVKGEIVSTIESYQ